MGSTGDSGLLVPSGRIGKLEVGRLIIGGNQFSGWSHSRDLGYLRELFKAYSTPERIMDTFELCEECGINTFLSGGAGEISRYWRERGGKMQWIAQVHPKSDDIRTNIKQAIDAGAAAAYVQGGVGDSFTKGGRVDLLGEAVGFIKSQGVVAGIGGHSIEVQMAVEKAGIEPDFYMKTLHHDRYWSATPKGQRVEFNVDSGSAVDYDNIWEIDADRTIAFMEKVERPWIAFKVLAAGAIHPREGLRFAFENGADFACVGMFDFQVRENAILTRDILKAPLNRRRAWMA